VQSLPDRHDTLQNGSKPAGTVPADQDDPPSVVYNAAATVLVPSAPAPPTATHTVRDGHDTSCRLARPRGGVPSDQDDPPSAV
jgi:hypothetical protein